MDFAEFFRRIITAPGTGGLEAQALQSQGVANQAADAALQFQQRALAAQQQAAARAEQAAIPAADKESTRLASEAEHAQALARCRAQFRRPLGAAPLGFTTLTGQ
jgi:nitrogen fixation protein FixH